ncbi:hypothetical protein [Parendozoicomonas haliclonae]|uniref:Uncharacterized protein n=1 Tax=Parendozoicomonas haliclonae TaxID=1960125 RepID=A0A1X7AH53_9GAMM|nr:hypothetical protein [Parendozoicomonas haliclonae]SMA41960.1 hypothetical protein EHSB41UT_01367 [Parendozoicomonas haliclonae]
MNNTPRMWIAVISLLFGLASPVALASEEWEMFENGDGAQENPGYLPDDPSDPDRNQTDSDDPEADDRDSASQFRDNYEPEYDANGEPVVPESGEPDDGQPARRPDRIPRPQLDQDSPYEEGEEDIEYQNETGEYDDGYDDDYRREERDDDEVEENEEEPDYGGDEDAYQPYDDYDPYGEPDYDDAEGYDDNATDYDYDQGYYQ